MKDDTDFSFDDDALLEPKAFEEAKTPTPPPAPKDGKKSKAMPEEKEGFSGAGHDSDDEAMFGDEIDFSMDDSDIPESDEDLNAPPKRPGINGIIDLVKANLLYVVIGLVVLIVVFYLVFGVIFSGSSAPRRRVVRRPPVSMGFSRVQHHAAAPTGQPQVQHAATAPSNSVQITKDQLKVLLEGFQTTVANQNAMLEKKIGHLSDQVSGLKDELASSMAQNQKENMAAVMQVLVSFDKQLQKTLAGNNKEVSAMVSNVAKVPDQMKKVQQKLNMLLIQRLKNMEKLTLRAVVPGRAWLVSGSGKTVTVADGSDIPYYGKVERIDSDKNKVYMSTGYVFS